MDAQVDNILQETVDVQYILDEDGNQIVYEDSEVNLPLEKQSPALNLKRLPQF